MAHSDPLRVIQLLRQRPLLISVPLAALAVGAGVGAQALLRPSVSSADRDLLDALMAAPPSPSRSVPGAAIAEPSPAPPALGAGAGAISAHRAAAASAADGALTEPEQGPTVPLEIRVALLKLPANPGFAANGGWRLLDRGGRILQQGSAQQQPDPSGFLQTLSEVWLEPVAGATLLSGGRAYEGRFRILRGAAGVQVINHLPLESYVSSVVGGEMPSHWNREALRAQAVAARSYALAHMARPADSQWHLGDTTRWQNYEGLSSVTGSTRDATASTSGVILSYQGGIVESLYAATQQIVEEAHGHLGASMSQTGAQELAQQGLRYNEILGRYYQGASLARLQAGAG
ncbi:MAG: SpoIID/LytB domain-containing protein [Cyanobium sp.]